MHKPHEFNVSANPSFKQVFWCDVCDHRKVDSEDLKTGKFYIAFGHVWGERNDNPDVGDWRSVVYAVCPHCDEQIED